MCIGTLGIVESEPSNLVGSHTQLGFSWNMRIYDNSNIKFYARSLEIKNSFGN